MMCGRPLTEGDCYYSHLPRNPLCPHCHYLCQGRHHHAPRWMPYICNGLTASFLSPPAETHQSSNKQTGSMSFPCSQAVDDSAASRTCSKPHERTQSLHVQGQAAGTEAMTQTPSQDCRLTPQLLGELMADSHQPSAVFRIASAKKSCLHHGHSPLGEPTATEWMKWGYKNLALSPQLEITLKS